MHSTQLASDEESVNSLNIEDHEEQAGMKFKNLGEKVDKEELLILSGECERN